MDIPDIELRSPHFRQPQKPASAGTPRPPDTRQSVVPPVPESRMSYEQSMVQFMDYHRQMTGIGPFPEQVIVNWFDLISQSENHPFIPVHDINKTNKNGWVRGYDNLGRYSDPGEAVEEKSYAYYQNGKPIYEERHYRVSEMEKSEKGAHTIIGPERCEQKWIDYSTPDSPTETVFLYRWNPTSRAFESEGGWSRHRKGY